MSSLKTIIVKPIIIAAFVLALLVSLVITASMFNGGSAGGTDSSVTRIELQGHKGPGKHKRCKPQGKYGKPKPPKQCRRRGNGN